MTILDAIKESLRVIHALILREMQTRFGRQKLGYIWAFVEPVLYVGVLALIFSIRGKYHPPGMTLILFLITGIVPFLLFRNTMTNCIKGQDQSKSLLTYPQVHIMDIAVAKLLLEIATSMTVFLFLLLAIHLLRIEVVDIQIPLAVLAGIFLMALFGFSLGLIFGSLALLVRDIEPMVQIFIGRPLFFISGVFFTIEMVPEEYRHFLLINPLFHVVEWLRSMFFLQYESRYADMGYALSWLIALLFLGLVMQRALRRHAFSL